MGNRAHVIFTNKDESEITPAVYLHWNGGPESVYAFLAELDRRKVRADQDYEVARFVQIVGEFMDQDKLTSLSLGLHATPKSLMPKDLEDLDHGDNGVYIICRECTPLRMKRYGDGKFWSEKAVAQEYRDAMQHKYNTEGDTILGGFIERTKGKAIEA